MGTCLSAAPSRAHTRVASRASRASVTVAAYKTGDPTARGPDERVESADDSDEVGALPTESRLSAVLAPEAASPKRHRGKLRIGRAAVLSGDASSSPPQSELLAAPPLSFANVTASEDGLVIGLVTEVDPSTTLGKAARLLDSTLPDAVRFRWADERGYRSAQVRKSHLRDLPQVITESIEDVVQDVLIKESPEIVGQAAFAIAAVWESTIAVASVGPARIMFHDAKGVVAELSNSNAMNSTSATLFRGETGASMAIGVRLNPDTKVLQMDAPDDVNHADNPESPQALRRVPSWHPQFRGRVRGGSKDSTASCQDGESDDADSLPGSPGSPTRRVRHPFLLIGSPGFFAAVPPVKACQLCSAKLELEAELYHKKAEAIHHLGADSVVVKSLETYDALRTDRVAQGLCKLAQLAGAPTASVIVVEWDF